MNKKFLTKVVTGALVLTVGATPILNSAFAMENEVKDTVSAAWAGHIAVNGFPKVSTSSVVGPGYNTTGYRVQSAQYLLKQHGHNLDIYGSGGPKTQAAIKSFQKLHKLEVDGFVGPKTWNKLVNGPRIY